MALIVESRLRALLQPVSVNSALDTILAFWADISFRPTNWTPGSLTKSTARFMADFVNQFTRTVPKIAGSGFLGLAKGSWLDLKGESDYDEPRQKATYATYDLVLESSASAQAWPIGPGALWVQAANGKRFNSTNTEEVTLAAGAGETLTIEVHGESPGADWNVASITVLETPRAGVTIQSSTRTSDGTDKETDPAYGQRCSDKWGTLAAQPVDRAVRYYAVSADDSITKANVDDNNPDGPGTVHVWIAGDAGAITDAAVVTAASDAVIAHKCSGAPDPTTESATNLACSVTGVIYVLPGYTLAQVQTSVEAALLAFQKAEPVGGTDVGGTKKVWQDRIKAYLQGYDENDDGDPVQRVPGLSLPVLTSGDFDILKSETAVITSALTYTQA